MTTPAERFAAQIETLAERARTLTEEGALIARAQVETLRRQVLAELAAAPGGTYDEFRLRQLDARLRDLGQSFVDRYLTAIAPTEAASIAAGQSLAAEPLVRAGIMFHVPQIPRNLWLLAHDYHVELVRGVTLEALTEISQAVRLGLLRGDSVFEVMQRLTPALPDAGVFGSLATRAESIASTEMGRIQALATQIGLEETQRQVPDLQKEWQHIGRGGKWTRTGHVEANGQKRPVREPFRVRPMVTGARSFYEDLMYPRDPAASAESTVFCFLPTTLIRSEIVGALKANYSGPARQIETAGGYRLGVTPNHPILTADGWLPAREIKKGHRLLTYRHQGRLLLGGVREKHPEYAPALIEDVFETFALERASVPKSSALDLHGDAVWAYGDVEVTGTYRELLGDGYPTITEESGDLVLVTIPTALADEVRERTLGLLLPSCRAIHARRMSRPVLSLGEFGRALERSPLEPLRFGTTPELDAVLAEVARQRAAGDTGTLRDCEERFAGEVVADEVRYVADFEYRGHVYDVESSTGVVVASGIIASNCRCVSVPFRASWEDELANARRDMLRPSAFTVEVG